MSEVNIVKQNWYQGKQGTFKLNFTSGYVLLVNGLLEMKYIECLNDKDFF